MKRDTWVKVVFFIRKKTTFTPASLHFWPVVVHYGFSQSELSRKSFSSNHGSSQLGSNSSLVNILIRFSFDLKLLIKLLSSYMYFPLKNQLDTVQHVSSCSVAKNEKKLRFYFGLKIDVNKCDSWTWQESIKRHVISSSFCWTEKKREQKMIILL